MASNHSLVLYDPQETSEEVKAAAGFLAGFSGRTREAYTLDLRQFLIWCDRHRLGLFEVTRTHIELYARELEDLGRAPATIGRRLSTLAGFYRHAAEEGVIEHSPAVHVRRPRLDYESHAVGLDRNELGAFLVAAGLSSPRDHAFASGHGAHRRQKRATCPCPHAVDLTNSQVCLGLAGGSIVRDTDEDALNLPAGKYELPLVIRDATFDSRGNLSYGAKASGFLGSCTSSTATSSRTKTPG